MALFFLTKMNRNLTFEPEFTNIMENIIYHKEKGIARITLNRPDKFNSFIRPMALDMQSCLDDAATDDSVRCVVITGTGKAFSAGQDLQEATAPDGPEMTKIVQEHYNPIVIKIREMPKPVVAAVNGVAAGAGANIALACDIVVASRSASFIQAFSKIGLIPDSGGTFTLPRLIGWQRASAIMMLGDKVAASDAVSMGMIYKVFEDDVFTESVAQMAELLAGMPTKGLALTKKALNESHGNDLYSQLAAEDKYQTMAGHSYDYREGTKAFLEKRPPVFKGH
jgi:2-(1,2-epoxy-1,2-dihydrophenyl)acetyl-CoA isomerase